MPKKSYTHLTLVVDRSGSMESLKIEAQQGITDLLADQFKQDGKLTVTLVEFDGSVDTVTRMSKVPVAYQLSPRGMTALFDAVGDEICATKADIAKLRKTSRPDRVIFVVVTDGIENASQKHKIEQVKSLIKEAKDNDCWNFQFIGAGESAWQGEALGMATTSYSGNSGSLGMTYGVVNSSISNLRQNTNSTATLEVPSSIG